MMVRGFNDPQTMVREKMAHLPSSLHLTKAQRKEMEAIYLHLAVYERKVLNGPGSLLAKRAKVGPVSRQTDEKIRRLLTPQQYAIIKRQSSSRLRKGTP